jgi:GTP-binding protein LepA
MSHIRNFCIIAHIDHGKSTLADRMLEITNTVRSIDGGQMLDTMDLEQERGITIKLTPVRMQWKWYELNLIDTPGHVDFQYEVSRSLAAVEGCVLLVDASQWVQAQTLSVLYAAIDNGLTIIPVLNKIDLPAADPERVSQELINLIGCDANEIICVSGKTGLNVEQVLDAIVARVDTPEIFKNKHPRKYRPAGNVVSDQVTRALIFDSVFDPYRGVVCYVKCVDGNITTNTPLQLIHSQTTITPTEVGYFAPKYHKNAALDAGQIGYIVTGQKSVRDARIGDTMLAWVATQKDKSLLHPYTIPGFKQVKPFVYAGVYPIDTDLYEKLKSSFEKLALNDSAIQYTYEQSNALGHGFRVGFLGMLHMDIIKERLWREYQMDTIFTTPTVTYLIQTNRLKHPKVSSSENIVELIQSGYRRQVFHYLNIPLQDDHKQLSDDTLTHEQLIQLQNAYSAQLHDRIIIHSWSDLPEQSKLETIMEPMAMVEIVGPEEYSGNIMNLSQDYRGRLHSMEAIDTTRMLWKYLMPMGEFLIDFYDKLKSATKGYATMNYEFMRYEASELARLDIFVHGDVVEAFSQVVHKDKAYTKGHEITTKLKDLIPRQMFAIPIQAGIGTKMIARETISAMKKDVLAKCYGWDISRKRKLLEKQKAGKKKMKMMGKVSIPSDIFMKMVTK